MAQAKFDVIKPFSGGKGVSEWLEKVELVAKLTDVKDAANYIPLFLEGGALAVYMEMSEADRLKPEKIKERLKEAFNDSQCVAFSKLKVHRWTGEEVDVYANELRRLARESGFKGDGLEQLVKLAFITGVPDAIGVELQQVEGVDGMTVCDILPRARVLLAVSKGVELAAPAVEGKLKCFDCGGPHLKRECPSRKPIVCFKCGKEGHMKRQCNKGKHKICSYGYPLDLINHTVSRVPIVKVSVNGKEANALVDTGCSGCLVQAEMVTSWSGRRSMAAFDGRTVQCKGEKAVEIGIGNRTLPIVATVVDQIVGNIDVVLGMDVIKMMGGVTIKDNTIEFGQISCGVTDVTSDILVVQSSKPSSSSNIADNVNKEIVKCGNTSGGVTDVTSRKSLVQSTEYGSNSINLSRLEKSNERVVQPSALSSTVVDDVHKHVESIIELKDKDFTAKFDGEKWTVEYFWNSSEPHLTNSVSQYKIHTDHVERFDKEVQRWIEEGILSKWEGEVEGVIPLMAVEQPTKDKVRPVLDFRELNEFVSSHTGDDVDICGEKLREWRKVEGQTKIVDLKSAYLQIWVAEELWKHQLVRYKGEVYCLTRLGFGLNSAPRIMTKILRTVLARDNEIRLATSSYIDDIIVDVNRVSAEAVVTHLGRFGLQAKPPADLENGTALGLRIVRGFDGVLKFSRGNEIPEATGCITKRELFSICGKLVGHYPVAGWLRVACSYVKRHAEGEKWGDNIGAWASKMINDIIVRVKDEDPVRGNWKVSSTEKGKVWCDASDLALGVVVDIDGVTVEDAAWMRKKGDYNHINVAELEAVLKGVNLCIKWELKEVTVVTDSATVCEWVRRTLSEEKRIKTKGAAELLIRRRLCVLKELIKEYDIKISVELVKSERNKADDLTRIFRRWMTPDTEREAKGTCAAACDLKKLHDRHHMGVERTWFLAKKIDPSVSKDSVKEVVKSCERCQSIDPAPTSHKGGDLGVNETWRRAAIDITHYNGIPYLSFIDCGPGRFAIWRQLKTETASAICSELNQIFFERGPVEELLMDNATAFRGGEMEQLLEEWQIKPFYRAAYRPSGNGIIERNHRTIKAMAARGHTHPVEATYWYNMSPRDRQREGTVPQRSIYGYVWRQPAEQATVQAEEMESEVSMGDEVWVKPPNARCTTQWKKGVVTKVNTNNNVEVNGVPRHVLDVRRVHPGQAEDQTDVSHEAIIVQEETRYPQRNRQPPAWLADYDVEM